MQCMHLLFNSLFKAAMQQILVLHAWVWFKCFFNSSYDISYLVSPHLMFLALSLHVPFVPLPIFIFFKFTGIGAFFEANAVHSQHYMVMSTGCTLCIICCNLEGHLWWPTNILRNQGASTSGKLGPVTLAWFWKVIKLAKHTGTKLYFCINIFYFRAFAPN